MGWFGDSDSAPAQVSDDVGISEHKAKISQGAAAAYEV
jgi:hypothetical protein